MGKRWEHVKLDEIFFRRVIEGACFTSSIGHFETSGSNHWMNSSTCHGYIITALM